MIHFYLCSLKVNADFFLVRTTAALRVVWWLASQSFRYTWSISSLHKVPPNNYLQQNLLILLHLFRHFRLKSEPRRNEMLTMCQLFNVPLVPYQVYHLLLYQGEKTYCSFFILHQYLVLLVINQINQNKIYRLSSFSSQTKFIQSWD